jgi:hypothetical protein
MLEYVGYLASVVVLISLLMSSIKKLRWINLFGSITFAIYGFLIGSIPVGVLNIGTSLINIYYLFKIFNAKDFFTLLPVSKTTQYYDYFLNYYSKDIMKFIPDFNVKIEEADVAYYLLRNAIPVGMFVGSKHSEDTLLVKLDYVIPPYRDFKMGKYVYTSQREFFTSKGFNKLLCFSDNINHEKYLLKMGFKKSDDSTTSNQSEFSLLLK